ncbi:MAG: BMP family ABC transporter substrate-binding protein [Anaerolineae bacterium]|nr:BMP family ABC transporter substrate-binding protein [Anaerolineae bacterium]
MSRHVRLFMVLMMFLALVVGVGVSRAQDSDLRVALIIAQGGLGDRSYNDSAFAGLTLAAQDFGVEVVPIESSDPVGEGEQLLRTAAESGFDLVITLEFSHFDPLARVAPDYPDTLFSIVNIVVDQPNIVSVMFDEHTGSYLAGALAALVTTDADIPNTNADAAIGVIGGVQSSGIDVFLDGYLQGACAINPDISVLFAYSNGFGDPATGRELALAMNEQGADVVFQVAGGTGQGVIEAAKDTGFWAVGVDSDQDYLAPGFVLTSMLKRVDIAVYDLISQLVSGELQGGTVAQYGLDKNGVGLSDMVYSRHLIPRAYMDQIDALQAGIIDGDIKVVDTRTITEEERTAFYADRTCAGAAALMASMG